MKPQASMGTPMPLPSSAIHFPGLYVARVLDVSPTDHAVQVILPAMAIAGNITTNAQPDGTMRPRGLKAKVLEHRAGPYIGDLDLPRIGDWGVVAFPHGSDQLAVWLGSLYQDFNNLATANPEEQISHHDSGVYWRVAKDGTLELSHPSGTYVRMGSGTTLAQRTRQEQQGDGRRSVNYSIPTKPAITLHIKHSSGTLFSVDETGNVTVVGKGTKAETIDQAVTETYKGTKAETVQGNVTEQYEQAWSLTVGQNGQVTVTGSLVIQADDVTVMSTNPNPGVHMHLGGTTGEDFVAMKAALDKIKAAYDGHVHLDAQGGNTGAPTVTMPAFVQDTDYSGQAKVT